MVAVTSGCFKVGPDYVDPKLTVPGDWRSSGEGVVERDYWTARLDADQQATRTGAELWWRRFNNKTLNKLISHAQEHSPTAYLAEARVREARAQVNVLRSAWYPWVGTRDEVQLNESLSPNFFASLEAGWEIDLFGRTGRAVEAAQAEWEGAAELKRDSMVIITANVATNYIAYCALRERLIRAEEATGEFRELFKVLAGRVDAGVAPSSDAQEIEAQLQTRETRLPQLRQEMEVAAIRLANTTGIYPSALGSILEQEKGIPEFRHKILLSTPANMLRNRPDVRREERKLAAQTARIGLAESDLYPILSISGALSWESRSSSDLFNQVNRLFGFGPKLNWRIFQAGRVRHRIAEEKARTEIRLANYQQQVLDAVAEIEIALTRLETETEYAQKLSDAVAAHKKNTELTRESYLAGLIDIRRALDALIDYHDTRDEEAAAIGRKAAFAAALFKSIGGGQLAQP